MLEKIFFPWKAGEQFADGAEFIKWLKRRLTRFGNARMLFLAAATILLIGGYMLDKRPVMAAAAAPLLVVLLLTMAIDKTEKAMAAAEKMSESQREL